MSLEAPELAETTVPPDARTAPRQPYPGLRPFDENEQRLFFGREYQIKEILRRLQQTYFAVVIGGSGSGKSSIVNAGVIPALRKKQLGASGDFWLAASFSPKDRPLWHLATVLADFIEPKSGQSAAETVEDVVQTLLETNSLAGFLQRYRSRLKLEEGQAPESRENANLLIFCDQFEEIFREQNRDNPETRQLVDLIVEAHRNRNDYPQLYVIIGMRSEDLHRCAQYIDLPNVINDASFLTRRLDETEIASAIVEPSRLVLRLRGIRPKRFEPIEVDPWPFEVELLRRLNMAVSSLAHNPDHLPLLQHLLSVLWRHVEGKPALRDDATRDPAAAAAFRITADDLAAALGFTNVKEADEFARRKKLPSSWILERALDQAAEGVMPTEDRLKRIAEMMFRLLALVDDRDIYTRRWTSRDEIANLTRDLSVHRRGALAPLLDMLPQRLRGTHAETDNRLASPAEIEAVIGAFTSVYPFLNVREGSEGKIDVSHEAFIRNWATFRSWLQDERGLALAFVALRTAYNKWREKLRDPRRRWLGWLSAVFGDRLSGEKLYQMRDWWNRRRYNSTWATRYARGVENQEAENEERRPEQVTDEMLRLLRRYYRRSRSLRLFTRALPLVLLMFLLGAAGIAYDAYLWGSTIDVQLAAVRPREIARAVSDEAGRRGEATEEHQARTRVFATAVAMEYIRNLRDAKVELEQYRKLRHIDDVGNVESAYADVDKAARDAMAYAKWPAPNSPLPHTLSASENLPQKCREKVEEYFRRGQKKGDDGIDITDWSRHTLAPLEPRDGKHLVMVRWPDTSLNFLLLTPRRDCHVAPASAITLPVNGDFEMDSDLRLVAVNIPQEGRSTHTRLYRLDWIRQCKNADAEECDVDFFPSVVWTTHTDGPYKIVDSSRVKVGEQQYEYELRRDLGATLLLKPEDAAPASKTLAETASAGSSSSKVVSCDKVDSYVAILAKDEQKNDAVRIVDTGTADAKGDRPCADYADERKVIASFDLRDHRIKKLAFAGDFLYLQTVEPQVIYKLAWKPARIRSMLCETVRKQNDNRIPSMNDLSLSADVGAILSKNVKYAPPDICKDTTPDGLARKRSQAMLPDGTEDDRGVLARRVVR